MIIEDDNGGTVNTHDPDRAQPDELRRAAEQADAYIRHARDTGHPVNPNAVPLLRLREALEHAR